MLKGEVTISGSKNAALPPNWGLGGAPTAKAGDVKPELRFSGLRSRFSERMGRIDGAVHE
jgi:hypothetical protein